MTNEAEVRDEFATLNGLRFHYRDWGSNDAPLLVVLHGFNSHSWDWDFLCEALANTYHIVALDQRGHGESDWAEDYSWPRFSEDIGALVDHLGVEQFTLFAYSVPAGFATMYTVSHPQRVRRLVLVDNTPTRNTTTALNTQAINDLRAESFADPSDVVNLWVRMSSGGDPGPIWHTVRHNMKQREDGRWILRDDKRAVPFVFGNPLPPEEHWQMLAQITCPTLVVHAENSHIFTSEAMDRMAATIPNCELVRLKDSGHRVQWDNPTGLLNVVLPFLLT